MNSTVCKSSHRYDKIFTSLQKIKVEKVGINVVVVLMI